MDNCGNSRANTCIQARLCRRVVFIRLSAGLVGYPLALLVSSTLDRFVLTWAFLVALCGFCSSWSLLTIWRFKELSWHRNLRVKRKRARFSFEAKEVTSWNFHEADYPCNPAVAEIITAPTSHDFTRWNQLGWNCPCQPSGAKNGANRSYCSSCGSHYTLVKWWPMTQSRGRSASKRRQGTTATEDIQWWQGRATQSTALWTGGIFKGSCSSTMGGNYPNQDGVFVTPQGSRASRGACGAHGGEDGRTRSSFSPEASPFGERRFRTQRSLAKLAVIEKSTSDSTPTTITHKTVNQLKRAEKAFESTWPRSRSWTRSGRSSASP